MRKIEKIEKTSLCNFILTPMQMPKLTFFTKTHTDLLQGMFQTILNLLPTPTSTTTTIAPTTNTRFTQPQTTTTTTSPGTTIKGNS